MLPITRRHVTVAAHLLIVFGIILDLGGGEAEEKPARVIRSDPFLLQLFGSFKSFVEAKSYCESKSSWLVEVKTAKVWEDLKALTRSYRWMEFWVGGYYSASGWRWTDDTSIMLESPGYTANRCLVLKTNRTLMPNHCDSRFYFVCQAEIDTTIFASGYEYRVSRDPVTNFEAAKSWCSAWDDSAHLADITSREIDDAITDELTRRFENSSIFTGGNDNIIEGTWVWSNGTQISGYTNWKLRSGDVDEPNGGTEENCLFKHMPLEWTWVDMSCEIDAKATCQKRVFDNRCSSDLCSNRGQCVTTSILQGMLFNCNCNDSFIGRMCEIDSCSPNPCQNLGTCAGRHDPPYYMCSCSPEFQGNVCEDRVFKNFDICSYHVDLQRSYSRRQAMSNCSSIGSKLAILSDQKMRDFVSNWIEDSFSGIANPREIWVGGNKTSNGWEWLDGTTMESPGRNNSYADNECVTGSVGRSWEISTSDCGTSLGFVCERPVDTSPCSTQPCHNGGICRDVGCHYKCECAAGYAGFTCSDGGHETKAWVVGLVIILLAVVLLLAALLTIRRRRVLPVTLVAEPVAIQTISTGELGSYNFAYENVCKSSDVQRSGTDVPIGKFEDYYKALIANANAGFANQYTKLIAVSEEISFPRESASIQKIQKKKQFKDIISFNKIAVRLAGDKKESYMNASFNEEFSQGNKFIATQGPLPATVNGLWRLVAKQQCHTIVMLTKCVEKGKEKCAKYWPDHGRKQTYGQISVHNESETKKTGYFVRSLKVTLRGATAITIRHYQFIHWPDEGAPVTTTEFMAMQREISHRLQKLQSTVPALVHCSDGAGRTGVFIAFDLLSEQKNKLEYVDVFNCVHTLLMEGVQMAQNVDQYIFIHKLLLEHYLFGNTEIEIENLPDIVREKNFSQRISNEFSNLSRVQPLQYDCVDPKYFATEEDDGYEYVCSGIAAHQLPNVVHLPFFDACSIPTSDDNVRMIASQGPARSSIAVFWRMLFADDISIVVLLTKNSEDKEEQRASYWPNAVGSELNLDCLTVEMTKMQTLNATTVFREFRLTIGKNKKNVMQYQFKDWLSRSISSNQAPVLDMITLVKSKLPETKNRSILIHCTDGVVGTGTFCAIWNLLDCLSRDPSVDVFRVVKDLRDFRRGMVRTEDEYRFCYQAMSEYATSTAYSTYDISYRNDEGFYDNL